MGGRTVPLQFGPSTDGNGEFTVRIAVPSLSPGTYDVVAEVYGKAARTSVEINQLPQPQLPPRVSRVSPTSSLSIAVGTIQQFTAQARDPNDDITRVEWLVNGQMERSEPIGSTGDVRKSWSYRVRSTGNYRVSARFTDGIGQSGSVEWQVEAVAQTPPPRVDGLGCGPITVAIEETVTCNPRLSGGDASRHSWRADGGVPWSGGQETFSTAWGTVGQKEIELEVCNPQNVCDTSTQIVTVEDAWAEPPKIVTLGCSPPFVEVGEFVSCYPEIRTDGPVEYSWRAAGGLPSSGDGRSFRTRWPSEGAWEMTLRVCSDGGCSNASSAGGVSETPGGNRPPVAARVSPSSPVTLRAGQAQTFTARAIDAEGNLHAAGWLVSQWYTPANVGFSSTSSSTQQFTHVFNAPGNYRVSVIYYDRRWEASIVGWDVTVVEGTSSPTGTDSGPQNDGTYTVHLELEHDRVDDLEISVGLGPLDNPEWERAITLPSIGKHSTGFRGEITLNEIPRELSSLNPNLWLKVVGSRPASVGQISSFALGTGPFLLQSPNLPIPISGNETSFVLLNPESLAEKIIGLKSDVENVYLYYQGLNEEQRDRLHRLLLTTATSAGIKLTVEVVGGILIIKAAPAVLIAACGGPARAVICAISAPVLIYEFHDDAIEIIGNAAKDIKNDFSYALGGGAIDDFVFYVEEGDVAAGERFNQNVSNFLSISGSTVFGGGWATKGFGKTISRHINVPKRMLSSKTGSLRVGSGSVTRETIVNSLVSDFAIHRNAANEIVELLTNHGNYTPGQFKNAMSELRGHLDPNEYKALLGLLNKTTKDSTGIVSNVRHLEALIDRGYRVRTEVKVGDKVVDAVIYPKGTTSQNPLAVQEIEQFNAKQPSWNEFSRTLRNKLGGLRFELERGSVPTLAKAAGRRQVILDATFSEMESIIPGEANAAARLTKLKANVDEFLGTRDGQWSYVDESVDDIIIRTADGHDLFHSTGKKCPTAVLVRNVAQHRRKLFPRGRGNNRETPHYG